MKKNIVLTITIVVLVTGASFAGMAIMKVGPFDSPVQAITVQVLNSHGSPLKNASVQGIMYNPPGEGGGTATIFVDNTNTEGYARITNLTSLKNETSEWVKYQGSEVNSLSHPNLLLLVTYNNSNGTYLTIGSIALTTQQIMKGRSFNATVTLPLNSYHKLVPEDTNSEPAIAPVLNPSNYGLNLPQSIPDGSYVWLLQSDNITSLMDIPVTYANIVGDGSAYVQATATTTLNYNVGFALNPSSTSTAEYNAGGSGYGTNMGATSYSFDNGESVYSTSQNGTGYVWIEGSVEGAYYQEYYFDGRVYFAENVYFYDTGIVNVQVSGSSIINGVNYGNNIPATFSAISSIEGWGSGVEETSGQAGTGNGNFGDFYMINSTDLVEQYSASDYSWISLGIGLGAMLLSAIPGLDVAGVALGVIGLVWGTIQFGSGTSHGQGYVQYNAPTGYYINTYVTDSSTQYYLTNGYTGTVPMTGVEVYAYTSGGGGGGCVLNGSLISLSNGSYIPVQSLKPGMKLLSYDTSNGTLVNSVVANINSTTVHHIIEINNGLIYLSGLGDQPVYVMNQNGSVGWKMLGFVTYGDRLYDPVNESWITVHSIILENGNFTVFDVVTARNFVINGSAVPINDYIANGILLDVKT